MIIDGSIIAGHVKIGKNVVLGLNTSVLQNIKIHNVQNRHWNRRDLRSERR